MKITATRFEGVHIIDLDPACDERGFFARSWSRSEFSAQGLDPDLTECGISFNLRRGTLRGLHYQLAPFEQVKLVRCTAGALFDVVLDLRAGSATRGQWEAFELSGRNHRMLYIPRGFAHGFQTLCDETEVFYQMTGAYSPEHATGVRWDDPRLAISWPSISQRIISRRDQTLPYWEVA